MKYEGFAVSSCTLEGNKFAGGGLCLPGKGQYFARKFLGLSQLIFDTKDIYNIDYILAHSIKSMGEPSLIAAGATICIRSLAHANEKTGGVLGAVDEKITSSQGKFEKISHDLWLYTACGGPGFVIQGDRESAESILKEFQSFTNGPGDGDNLLHVITSKGISCYLIVCDSTGADTQGVFAVSDGISQSCYYL